MRLLKPVFRNLEAYKFDRWAPADGRPVVLNVSGGRSSAFQAWHIVEANGGLPAGVLCNFNNTSKERPATYDFIASLDAALGLDIHYLEYDSTDPKKVRRVQFHELKREGEVFDDFVHEVLPRRRDGTPGVRPLPNPAQRTCTAQLKIKTLHRYARRVLGWSTQYHCAVGYRADERARYERRVKQDRRRGWPEGGRGLFPMFHAGAVQEDIQRFWMHAPFDLDLDSAHGNCDYCFSVSTWKLKERMALEAMECQIKRRPGAPLPPRLASWVAYEERQSDRPGPFRRDRPTLRELWEQVCVGDMQSAVPEADDVCQVCVD